MNDGKMEDGRWRISFCTGTPLFKMKLEQPQPQIRGKMNRQQFYIHHGLPVVATGRPSSVLLFFHGRGIMGEDHGDVIQTHSRSKCRVKVVKTYINHQRTIPKHKPRI